MITVKPSEKKDISKVSCCYCGARFKGMGLSKESVVSGLQVKCGSCGRFCEVASAPTPKPQTFGNLT